MALTDKLTAIADAIRLKTGGTETLTLDQMPTQIAGISAGGDPIYEIELMTLVEELSISDILTQVQYACKYKNSVIQLRGYGENPPTAGSYTVNCYELWHKGALVLGSRDQYINMLVAPNDLIYRRVAEAWENRAATINSETGVIGITATTSPIGGIGTVVKLYEIPVAFVDETQTNNVWGE